MRIAQIAPLYESVPPTMYGGTERVVSWITETLVEAGHDVTLFASGDSSTKAKLVALSPRSLRLDESIVDHLAHHVVMMEEVFRSAHNFDILHFHTDYLHFPLTRRHDVNTLTTLHGRLDIPDLKNIFREFSEMPVVSISDSQRAPLWWLNWQATVYHGLPKDNYKLYETPGKYLLFLGRISPEKGVPDAIRIAREVGMPLKIAAKVDAVDQAYFENVVRPLINHPSIEFIGEVGEDQKGDLIGNAYAVIFAIDWPEPFGLVMIESFACGTPVIAFRRGSVPEVMVDGVTGYICNDASEAIAMIPAIAGLSRSQIRKVFEERYTSAQMTRKYLSIYEQIIDARLPKRQRQLAPAGQRNKLFQQF